MKQHHYIIGFMGSGKTTIGESLAEKMKFQVVDVDQWIEEKEQQAIKDIFAEKGESYFRQLETEALQQINGEPLLITTGGGIVERDLNLQIMKEKGTIIYLKCGLDEIFRRLEGDESRPNFQGNRQQIEALFMSRQPYYEQADITIDTTNKSVADIVNELHPLLK